MTKDMIFVDYGILYLKDNFLYTGMKPANGFDSSERNPPYNL